MKSHDLEHPIGELYFSVAWLGTSQIKLWIGFEFIPRSTFLYIIGLRPKAKEDPRELLELLFLFDHCFR